MGEIKSVINRMSEPTKSIGSILIDFYEDMKSLETNHQRDGKQAARIIMAMNDISRLVTGEPPSDLAVNEEFTTGLRGLGFTDVGGGWYRNYNDTIRIHLLKDWEVDFWMWNRDGGADASSIPYRGQIFSIEDVKWVLDHCFNKPIEGTAIQ